MKIKILLFSIVSLFFGLLAVIGVGAALSNRCPDFNQATLLIDQKPWSVAVARTSSQQAHGLAGCQAIPEGHGLYFPFKPPAPVSFWMKDMVIPIDIIWLADGKVVGIVENVPPPRNLKGAKLPFYQPPVPVDGVLEIGAGEAKGNRIGIGTKIAFDKSR